jgi:hypothetical protein
MKDTIDMAREAGFGNYVFEAKSMFELFEALVRADERNLWPAEMEAMERQVNILTDALAAEREACAKVCEELVPDMSRTASEASVWDVATFDCAGAIRNRGNS